MNDTFYNLSSGFESLIKTLPEKFIWQYQIVLRGGFPEHIWILSSDKGAVHISARPSEWEKRFEWIGGIECHWTEPPEWADAEKPSHDHCWILGKPCWHDGSSLYFSENISPQLPEVPSAMSDHHHEYMLFEMMSWFRTHIEEAESA